MTEQMFQSSMFVIICCLVCSVNCRSIRVRLCVCVCVSQSLVNIWHFKNSLSISLSFIVDLSMWCLVITICVYVCSSSMNCIVRHARNWFAGGSTSAESEWSTAREWMNENGWEWANNQELWSQTKGSQNLQSPFALERLNYMVRSCIHNMTIYSPNLTCRLVSYYSHIATSIHY